MGKGFIIDGTTKQTVIDTAECLLAPGAINLGWHDISNVLLHDGETVIAFGSGTGKSRATKACDDTLSGYRTAAGTTKRPAKALFRLTGPENLLLKEVNDVREAIERSVGTTGDVTFGVACDNSLNDEVRIILLTTLEEKHGLSVTSKLYSTAEADLVDDWADKWLELIKLINEITGTDEPPWSPSPPAETVEIQYARLRFWFLSRQQQFVPLWSDFCASQHPAGSQNGGDPDGFPEKYLENPFLYFYEPENLYRLAQQLELQSGTSIWEPSEHVARMLRPLLIGMGKRMIEFLDWIDERV
ncbi:MAG: hypothetical protein Q8O43_08290 [Dehalococcoidia bacterium]|nr:hypothetical protein [Dehalococcoidia bacterium]